MLDNTDCEINIDPSVEEVNVVRISIEERNRLCLENMKLARSIAWRFMGLAKYLRAPVELEDLIQDAYVALLEYAEKFDPEGEYTYSQCAYLPMFKYVRESLLYKCGRLVRQPAGKEEMADKIRRARRDLWRELNRAPSIEEVAKAVGITREKVIKLAIDLRTVLSFDNPFANREDEGGGTNLYSLVPDPDGESLHSDLENIEWRGKVRDVVNSRVVPDGLPFKRARRKGERVISERHSNLLRLLYGLNDPDPPDKDRDMGEVARSTGAKDRRNVEMVRRKMFGNLREVEELRELARACGIDVPELKKDVA